MPLDVPPNSGPPVNVNGPRIEIVSPARVSKNKVVFPDATRVARKPKPPMPPSLPRSRRVVRYALELECTPRSLAEDNVPINSIKIPQGLEQFDRDAFTYDSGDGEYYYEFVPRKDDREEAKFLIRWDGSIVQPKYQAAWRRILTKPPHKLSKDEIEFVRRYLYLPYIYHRYEKPHSFQLKSAKTSNWNGRKVVETISETVLNPNGTVFKSHAITFDNYGDFGTAAEVSYCATKKDFTSFKRIALKAMKSIRWTKPGERDPRLKSSAKAPAVNKISEENLLDTVFKYVSEQIDPIFSAWKKTKYWQNTKKEAEVSCTIERSGKMVCIRISRSSGDKELDATAISIVKKAASFSEIPENIPDQVDVSIDFGSSGHCHFQVKHDDKVFVGNIGLGRVPK